MTKLSRSSYLNTSRPITPLIQWHAVPFQSQPLVSHQRPTGIDSVGNLLLPVTRAAELKDSQLQPRQLQLQKSRLRLFDLLPLQYLLNVWYYMILSYWPPNPSALQEWWHIYKYMITILYPAA